MIKWEHGILQYCNIQIKIIWAIVLRYMYAKPIKHRILSAIYWSSINIVIWGTSSTWLEDQAQLPKLRLSILTTLALWQIVFRVNLETAKSLYGELKGKNLVNLFALPLKLSHWIFAVIILGIIETFLITLINSLIIFITYSVNIFNLDTVLLLLSMLMLLLSGLSIGFIICGIVLNLGKKTQDFVYSFGYIFAPFSAIYYPMYSLPSWAKFISALLPTTYVFESIREYLYSLNINFSLLKKSLALNLVYFIISIIFLNLMFKISKSKGFLRL